MSATPWWRSAVIYQIYPRSFADANGDGVGDLNGLTAHLDHLAWLGVDGLWLSPVFRSPMFDFGYDVSDYCDVDPVFGTLADLDVLVAEAHARNLKVLLDWVPNHTSHEHPWFVASRSSRQDPKRDWYIWRDARPDGSLPNNWTAAFVDAPAWTLDEATGQYYLHLFLPQQPDLNWANPEVEEAMHEVLRFWLDRGIDGFRMDVIHNIGKSADLLDDPVELVGIPHTAMHEDPSTHPVLRRLRTLLDSYPGDRVAVGEVYLIGPGLTERVARYLGEGDELHLAFDFSLVMGPWDPAYWRARIAKVERVLGPKWPTWVLSNHDNRRHATRFGTEARARAGALALLCLRGTPFLYAGEELGLEDAVIPPERVVDPGGRDGCRAPLPWTIGPAHGWGAEPWLPWPPDAEGHSVEAELAEPASVLHLYRRLLAARRASPALHDGDLELLDMPEGALGWRRRRDGDGRVVLVNFTAAPLEVPVPPGTWGHEGIVEVASDGEGEGAVFSGTLRPDQAVLLR